MYNKKLLFKNESKLLIGTLTVGYVGSPGDFMSTDVYGYSEQFGIGSISDSIKSKLHITELYYFFRYPAALDGWVVNVDGVNTSDLRFNVALPTVKHKDETYTESDAELYYDSTIIPYTSFSKDANDYNSSGKYKIWGYGLADDFGGTIPLIIEFV